MLLNDHLKDFQSSVRMEIFDRDPVTNEVIEREVGDGITKFNFMR
jgi:hypothetical protein